MGGGVGALVAIAVIVFVVKRRGAGSGTTAGSASLRSTYNPTYGATATLATGPAPDKLELAEVVEATGTPRSARRRNNTPFNG